LSIVFYTLGKLLYRGKEHDDLPLVICVDVLFSFPVSEDWQKWYWLKLYPRYYTYTELHVIDFWCHSSSRSANWVASD